MVKSGNPKAIGWLSSIAAIILALLLLHTFPLMGNWIDKQRAGEGKYQFDEVLCFDISKETEFDNSWNLAPATGVGSLRLAYYVTPATSKSHHNKFVVMDVPLNDTVDAYGVTSTGVTPGDIPVPNPAASYVLYMMLNFTKKKIIDLDITSIVIYMSIPGATFTKMSVLFTDAIISGGFSLGSISLGNKTKLNVDVFDLLEINTLDENENIQLIFSSPDGGFIPANAPLIFDMQWYCIEEIKAPTITRLAGWMSLMNIGILILVFISFPEVQVLGRFNSIGERLKKI